MNIGYACLLVGVGETNIKSCTMKNANEDNLLKIIKWNLKSLDKIIDYNIKNKIKFFRISSDMIPFGSSPVNKIKWWDFFREDLKKIGDKIKESEIRVSMHPGQYTVINSPKEDVVENSFKDLAYHNRFLDSLGLDSKSKIILHIGGVYGDKESAIERFKNNYKDLSDGIKSRLIIENDDKSYNIEELLDIGNQLKIPVVYDNLHNQVLTADPSKSDNYWIKRANLTWGESDGIQKIHYSQQNLDKRPGSHSVTIDLNLFKEFVSNLDLDIDIMLEVKDKNLSVIKVNNYLREEEIEKLELEWNKYKYNILEHSPSSYRKIDELLKVNDGYPIFEFYNLIDSAFNEEIKEEDAIRAAGELWNYLEKLATEREEKKYKSYLESYRKGNYSIKAVKGFLRKMAVKYKEESLLSLYYFYF